jgi:alkylhydroperoxidase family enzyme
LLRVFEQPRQRGGILVNPHEPREGEEQGPPVNPFTAFAGHPALARAFTLLNTQVLMATSLSHRHRELLALRTAAQCSGGYEWIRQVFVGRDGSLEDEEVFRIAFGADSAFWSGLDAALLLAADDLVRDREISDTTLAALERELDTEQILDLIFTVRTYETLAVMMRAVGVQPDDPHRRARGD